MPQFCTSLVQFKRIKYSLVYQLTLSLVMFLFPRMETGSKFTSPLPTDRKKKKKKSVV